MEGESAGGVGVCEDYRGVIRSKAMKAGSFDPWREAWHIMTWRLRSRKACRLRQNHVKLYCMLWCQAWIPADI
jgi:hypothetical protein